MPAKVVPTYCWHRIHIYELTCTRNFLLYVHLHANVLCIRRPVPARIRTSLVKHPFFLAFVPVSLLSLFPRTFTGVVIFVTKCRNSTAHSETTSLSFGIILVHRTALSYVISVSWLFRLSMACYISGPLWLIISPHGLLIHRIHLATAIVWPSDIA